MVGRRSFPFADGISSGAFCQFQGGYRHLDLEDPWKYSWTKILCQIHVAKARQLELHPAVCPYLSDPWEWEPLATNFTTKGQLLMHIWVFP